MFPDSWSVAHIHELERDMSFLKSFYATRANAYAEYRRAQIKTLMKRDLERRRSEH
jgi:hypothetical protein